VIDYIWIEISYNDLSTVKSSSIPRWIVIAFAALLAVAIFAIVVHPDYDVSSATAGEKLLVLVFTFLVAMLEGTALLIACAALLANATHPQPLVVAKPNTSRRI